MEVDNDTKIWYLMFIIDERKDNGVFERTAPLSFLYAADGFGSVLL